MPKARFFAPFRVTIGTFYRSTSGPTGAGRTSPTGRHQMSIAIKVTDTITLTPASTDDELKAGVDAYRALDGNKLKAAVRKAANDAMMSAVMDMTLDAAESRANAQWAKNVGEMLVSAKASNQDDVDPAQILIDAVAELETAAWLIRNGLAVPAGLELADD